MRGAVRVREGRGPVRVRKEGVRYAYRRGGGSSTFPLIFKTLIGGVVPLGGKGLVRALDFGSRPSAIERGATKSLKDKNSQYSENIIMVHGATRQH